MAKTKKLLLSTIGILGLAIILAMFVLLEDIPSPAEIISELASKDPLLAIILPVPEGQPAKPQTQLDYDYQLQDLALLYEEDKLGEVTTLLVEVYDSKQGHLRDFETPELAEGLRLPVIVREGTSRGTVKWEGLGYSAVAANATLEVRGTPRQNRIYHNFKLRLEDAAGQYEGQSILNLKKAYGKPCRIEEKFAFDLFTTLPNMLSLRTRFVHLFIKDATAQNPVYADYGLYTMVEQPDKNYFYNRSLDDSGNLYQAENFDFSLHADLLQVSDRNYNKAAFEQILDIKQGDSHQNLLDMLEAVNDPTADIDQVIDSYFDRDNLLTWLAMNVLLANSDCVTQGYMIYKPALSAHWFFLPANLSDAMPAGGDDGMAQVMVSGVSMFYGNLLYERFLAKPENLEALCQRVDQLMERFSPEFIGGITSQYLPVLSQYLNSNPDRGMLKAEAQQIIERVAGYQQNLQLNVAAFYENLSAPRRVELLLPVYRDQNITLSWLHQRQAGAGVLRYQVEIAKDPGFERPLQQTVVIDSNELLLKGLPKGRLYWRVTVIDEQGKQAGSINTVELEDGSILYGAQTLMVL